MNMKLYMPSSFSPVLFHAKFTDARPHTKDSPVISSRFNAINYWLTAAAMDDGVSPPAGQITNFSSFHFIQSTK